MPDPFVAPTSILKKNKNGSVGIAVEQSVHYCPMTGHIMAYLIQTGSNVGAVQLPLLHSHFYLGHFFLECLFSLPFFFFL